MTSAATEPDEAKQSLREELRREEGLEVCRIVSQRVTLEFTRIIPEPETAEEGYMITELRRGDVVVILRDRGGCDGK